MNRTRRVKTIAWIINCGFIITIIEQRIVAMNLSIHSVGKTLR